MMIRRILIGSVCVLMIVLTIYFIKLGKSLKTQPSDNQGTVTGTPTQSGTQGNQTPGKNEAKVTVTPIPTPEPDLEIAVENKYAHSGNAKQETVKGPHFSYAFSYPVYDDDAVSGAVREAAAAILEEAKAELEAKEGTDRRLWIDYEDGEYRALTSVVFHVTKEVGGQKTETTSEWLYNKKKGSSYDAAKLFGEHAYSYISGKIAEEYGETGENIPETEYLYYLIEEDGAKFFYRHGDKSGTITVPYVEVHTYMAVTINGTERMDNIRELDPSKPMVALTYDDGPHSTNTKRLLQILADNNVKATFFELGDRLTWAGSKECAQMVYAAGHELASHTYSHSNLTRLSEEELQKEFSKTREIIYEYTGEYPTFVRAPGGNVNDTVKKYAFAPLINWSVDTRDWESRDRDKIVEEAMKGARNNRIFLMHDIHTCTVDASEILIPKLIAQGYQLVTLSELFYYNEIQPENGVLYRSVDY